MAGNSQLKFPAGQTGVDREVTASIDLQLGASGAVSSTINSNGILSASRTAAGEYTCTLAQGWLVDIRKLSTTIKGAVTAGKAYDGIITTDLSGVTFKVQFMTGGGVAGDVPDNAKINISVTGCGGGGN